MATIKKKITAESARAFYTSSKVSDVLWCSRHVGFHLQKYATKSSWRVKYRANGKQHIKTIGDYPTITFAAAECEAIDILAAAKKGVDAVAASKERVLEQRRIDASTFKHYLEHYYTAYQLGHKSGRETVRMLQVEFKDWADKPLASISELDANKWRLAQMSKGKSYSTVKRYWSACKGLLNKAVDDGVIEINPLSKWKLLKHYSSDEVSIERRQYLESHEAESLLRRLYGRPDCVYSNILLVIYYTGLRPSDVLGLMWEHLNLNFKTVRKVIDKSAAHKPEPTTLPLNNSVVCVLKRWQKRSDRRSGLVFCNKNNQAIHHRTLSKKMCGYSKSLKRGVEREAGIVEGLPLPESFTPYSLRHNFASQLVMSGGDIITVSELMCHSDIQTTIKHYAHLAADHKRSVAELMDGALPAVNDEVLNA